VVDKIQGAVAPAAPAAPAPALGTGARGRQEQAGHHASAANVAPVPAAKVAADSGDENTSTICRSAPSAKSATPKARAKLALLGFEANISDRATDTGVLHRVRMGPSIRSKP
jgi:cell division protein FtsN